MECNPEYKNFDLFEKDLKDFVKKHCNPNTEIQRSIEANLSLIKSARYQSTKGILGNKVFGKAEGFGVLEVYWTKLVLIGSGLKKLNQNPKCYVYMSNEYIVYLCCDSHLDNYKDSKLRKLAESRLNSVLEQLKDLPERTSF